MNTQRSSSANQFTMRQKLVFVTGSGSGIGRTVALEFARAGADVAPVSYTHLAADGFTPIDGFLFAELVKHRVRVLQELTGDEHRFEV